MKISVLAVILFLASFFAYSVWAGGQYAPAGSSDNRSLRNSDRITGEKTGSAAPRKDGTMTEFEQGVVYSVLRIWGSKDQLRRNQHLRPYSDYNPSSFAPVDIALTVGT